MIISICGSGNVGSALGLALIEKGYGIIFYDINPLQFDKLPIYSKSVYNTTTNFSDILKSDICFICVPTESLSNGDCDTSIIYKVVKQLYKYKYRGIIVQTSTCPPLTARRLSKMSYGDYVVCPSHYSMGRMLEDARFPIRILIGTSDGTPNKAMADIFSKFDAPIYFETFETAELTKYAENALSSTLISYWNELFLITSRLKEKGYNVDSSRIAKIIDGSPAFHSIYRFHGKAFGGLCLRKDLSAYINWSKKEFNHIPIIAKAVQTINELMRKKYGENTRHLIYRN